MSASQYAQPQIVTDLAECYFYHTMDIPGHGQVEGEWDLRKGIDDYLGHEDLRNKRVLEIGTASGFVCFEMERRGADVIAFDLPKDQAWDVVPFAQYNHEEHRAAACVHVRRLHNAWWLCHKAFGSNARVVYGSVYEVPEEIGPVDVAIFGCVLLHLRDPFQALSRVLRLTQEKVIVTEPLQLGRRTRWLLKFLQGGLVFLPDASKCDPKDTWWFLPAETVRQCLAVFGFEDTRVSYHSQLFRGQRQPMYTVVGKRTRRNVR